MNGKLGVLFFFLSKMLVYCWLGAVRLEGKSQRECEGYMEVVPFV